MMNESSPPAGFPTTRWSRVARAGDPGGTDARAALAELGRALDRLAADYAATGHGPLFESLQGVLTGGSRSASHAEVAADLGLTEAAVQQAASRLRKRYREALCDEIAATLDDPTD